MIWTSLAVAKIALASPVPAGAGAPAIDGRLDDPAWAGAAWTSDFAQKEPFEGSPPTDRTEIAMVFDRDALYVAARMTVSAPARLDRPMTRRDDTSGAERIIVSFDPHRSGRTAYSFAVTAAGVRADWIHTDDNEFTRDHSWNPVWTAAVQVGADAWTAEMRIPWSQLRFPADEAPVWGVNFNRYVPRANEDVFWSVVPKDRTGWSSYFGELRGLAGLDAGTRVELLPYVAGELAVSEDAGGGSPLDPGGNAGLDAKLGLGPSLTLDATVNPDFGQVEADPAVVNLGAFEIVFPERRPFFVEGAQIFTSAPRTYFYSRRIGAPPRDTPDGAPADPARILGAAKLTGRITPRTGIGALAAVTGAVDAGDGAGGVAEVAPVAGWGVLRLEREAGDEGSLAGLTLTGVARDLDDPFAAAALPRAAVTGGGDLRLRLDGGTYEVAADAGGSLVTGRPAAIERLQRASARWYQRPDADHVALDPDATVLAGWHASASAARRAGDWRWAAYAGAESPGLDLNDVGVLQSSDDVDLTVEAARVETEPGRLHNWSIRVADYEAWNFGGVHKPAFTELTADATLTSFHNVYLAAALTRPGLSDDLTRGGPLMGVGWGADLSLGGGSRDTGTIQWSASASASVSQTDTDGVALGGQLRWRPVDRVRLQLNPSVRAATVHQQYVATVEDPAAAATFGARYVFGELALRQVSTQLRAQIALSPDLTIDAYVEPFASSGRYARFGELPAPGARRVRRYDAATVTRVDGMVTVADGAPVTFADPDFTVLSLRSTAVLRWELRPGSVLFVVWQQDRGRADPIARGVGGGVLGDVFTAPGAHVLAVKLSYWWSP